MGLPPLFNLLKVDLTFENLSSDGCKLRIESSVNYTNKLKTYNDEINQLNEELSILESESNPDNKALIDKLNERIKARKYYIKVYSEFLDRINDKLVKEGAYANIIYKSNWRNVTSELNHNYKNKYEFKKVPLKNIRTKRWDKDESLNLGMTSKIYSTPFGEDESIVSEESYLLDELNLGNSRLTVRFACYTKEALGFDKLNFFTTYQYPVNYNYNISTSYNLFEIYKYVKKYIGSNELYSYENHIKVIEQKLSEDIFSINWKSTNYSESEKKDVEKNIKAGIIERILGIIAKPISRKTYDEYNNQKKCNIQNFYCSFIKWKFVDSDDSIEAFKSQHNYEVLESWASDEVKYATGIQIHRLVN